MAGRLFIGTSGYSYTHWLGDFYPKGLSTDAWLSYYSERFNSVELNYTFYHLPSAASCRKWYSQTPPGFVFAVKGSRYLTHIRRLRANRSSLSRFADPLLELGDKLGVVLWQTPPRFPLNIESVKSFLLLLSSIPPFDHCRHAFEPRDPSWFTAPFAALLAEAGHALVQADPASGEVKMPRQAYAYLRFHYGDLPDTCYSRGALGRIVKKVETELKSERDVFAYFNNDAFGCASRNAAYVAEKVGTHAIGAAGGGR